MTFRYRDTRASHISKILLLCSGQPGLSGSVTNFEIFNIYYKNNLNVELRFALALLVNQNITKKKKIVNIHIKKIKVASLHVQYMEKTLVVMVK